ncbi:MAG: hypothetical protein NVS2B16_30600 [Chloroflexota bacterium]
MNEKMASNPTPPLSRGALLRAGALGLASSLLGPGAALAERDLDTSSKPIQVTVFSPSKGDIEGIGGAGFIVDLALDAAPGHNNELLGQPRFIAPTDPAFGPGPNPAVPGLVVLFSTTKAFAGPRTNLANLFQITNVAIVNGNQKEVWATWLVGKPIAGTNIDAILTVFAVTGLAPRVVPDDLASLSIISNTVTVPFHIAG